MNGVLKPSGSRKRKADDVYSPALGGGNVAKSTKRELFPSDENQDFCKKCRKKSGQLILCDLCPAAFHLKCLDPPLKSVPRGSWSCPNCLVDDIEEDYHQESCHVCKKNETKIKGKMLSCDSCPFVFHLSCLDPPLKSYPEVEWYCPTCCEKPEYKVAKILSWRFVVDSKGERKREYFVKFHDLSFWYCDWLKESILHDLYASLLAKFVSENNVDEPPQVEDPTEEEMKIKFEMYDRYYKNGVKPEWLKVQRVLQHRTKDGVKWYLVKWFDLTYEFLTWEELGCDLLGFKKMSGLKKAIEIYEDYRAYWNSAGGGKKADSHKFKHLEMPPNKPISDLKQTLEEQPDYITNYGLELHPYQLEGLNWIRSCYAERKNTILADEMGLGKTIQSLAFLYSLYKEGHSKGPFLITAPLSTIYNWERELDKWAPDFYYVTYLQGGTTSNREKIRDLELKRFGGSLKFHVILTNYEMITRDSAYLRQFAYDVIVVDEAHRLKNSQSQFFKRLGTFKTAYKLCLTGTPLQNNLEELFNLLNFLNPGIFRHLTDFQRQFADVASEEKVNHLQELLKPVMLRRLKVDVVKSLPGKRELIVRVEMSTMQKRIYKQILTRNWEMLTPKNMAGQHKRMYNLMMQCIKCSNHPYLFPLPAEQAAVVSGGFYEPESLTAASAKLILLQKMLRKLKEQGHRVLIFSQMTRMMDLLEDFLFGEGYLYERLDGSVTGSRRQEAIDRFNAPDAEQFAFIISTRAGGLGINLATADTVIIYDSDWNPQNDIQAYSRAHRIGQRNNVLIYRFVTRNSVEERIVQVAKQKLMLTHLVVRPKGVHSISKADLEEIIRFGTKELFAETGERQIQYDDAAIETLLDRDSIGDATEEDNISNEFFSSYNVAMLTNGSNEKTMPKQSDPNYWAKLMKGQNVENDEDLIGDLGDEDIENYDPEKTKKMKEEEMKNLFENYGKGKRSRKSTKFIIIEDSEDSDEEEEDSKPPKEKKRRSKGEEDKEWTMPVKMDLDLE